MKVGSAGVVCLSVCEPGLCGTIANAAVFGPADIDTIVVSLLECCIETSG